MNGSADLFIAFGLQTLLLATPLAIGVALFARLTRDLHPRVRYMVATAAFFAIPIGALLLTGAQPANEAAGPSARAVVVTPASSGLEETATGVEALVLPFALLWVALSIILVLRDLGGHILLWSRKRRYTREVIVVGGSGYEIALAPGGVPMTAGLLKPRIVLPRRALDDFTDSTLESVVRHEASHAAWRDPLIHAAVRLTRFVLWPVLPLHYIGAVIAREAELAADLYACRDQDDETLASYAETLIEAARWQRALTARLAPSLTSGSLEERVRRLFERPGRSAARLAAALAATLFAGVVAAGVPSVHPGLATEGGEPEGHQAIELSADSTSTPVDAPRDPVHRFLARLLAGPDDDDGIVHREVHVEQQVYRDVRVREN